MNLPFNLVIKTNFKDLLSFLLCNLSNTCNEIMCNIFRTKNGSKWSNNDSRTVMSVKNKTTKSKSSLFLKCENKYKITL